MSTSARRIAEWVGACVIGAAALLATRPAEAQVFQTDAAKTPLPQPVGQAELSLVDDSWGWNSTTQSWTDPTTGAALSTPIVYGQYYSPPTYPQFVTGDAITLQGLFKWRHEAIDPVNDAKTGPGYFSPTCGFQGQLLLLGGNCKVSFGWYNVDDPNSTTPPTADQIYELIPSDPSYLNCLDENGAPKTDGFCPKGWDNRSPRNLHIQVWTPKVFDSGMIKTDPRYKGKYVGFAVVGNPATSCTQNKYSMYAYNQKNSSGVPWVTTLIYQSTVDPGGFYMAFEDLPMSAADWHQTGVPGNMGSCDGDFNDFVFYLSGLSCVGGNQPCTTGLQGACSVGRTDCAVGGETQGMCRPIVQPGAEICDNVDNDCNGVVDDGDNLCPDPDKPICFQGNCVGNCQRGEFPCPEGTACNDSGQCVDPMCASVTCPMGTSCKAGQCVDPCTGVTCPSGAQCELGRCVDPCAGITCPSGRVCDKGLCISDCSCTGCQDGFTCGADGRCSNPKCANVTCPAGQACGTDGTCVDACIGVVCPGGAACVNGVCGAPGSGTGGSGSGLGDGGLPIGSAGSLSFPGGGDGGTTARLQPAIPAKGCSCRVGQSESDRSNTLAWLTTAFALGLGAWARRRGHRPN